MAPAVSVTLSSTAPAEPAPAGGEPQRPAHHANSAGTKFRNPWLSFHEHTYGDYYDAWKTWRKVKIPENLDEVVKVVKPDWVASRADAKDLIKATWLGHASFLVELPSPEGSPRGVRLITDPVFSQCCSPVQFMGPARFTQPPCTIEEIPEVDIVLISHNHYDHLDVATVKKLNLRERTPHFFVPLGTASWFKSAGIKHATELDWWDERDVSVTVGGATDALQLRLTYTPAQHFTARGVHDRFATLWDSWCVQELPRSGETESSRPPANVWFAGDTGYRSCTDEKQDEAPVCPAFKEIGERKGPFALGLIPIGA